MLKNSKYYLSLLLSTLLFSACGDKPVSPSGNGNKPEGSACQENSECKERLACHLNICRLVCKNDNDCDVENFHCEDNHCLPGKATECGNGNKEPGEDCDDGNRVAGDGCNANCNLELGWKCNANQPETISVCHRTYGNCLPHFTGENCDECLSHFTGDNCDQCSGNFTGDNCDQCTDNFTGNNCDKCISNFTGEHCNECKDGFTGANCVEITCRNGTLNEETGECTSCNEGWDGRNCDKCLSGYFGHDCSPCNCLNGTCKDGLENSGKCQCDAGWEGEACDTESKCEQGFTGINCDKCLPEYYGLNCKPCSCKHGECNDTMVGDGYCRIDSCETGWDGVNCNKCAEGYTGPICTKITCINGTVNEETGTCTSCNKNWVGTDCNKCATGFAGDNCNTCAEGYTGTNCVKITCVNGTVNKETGTCTSCNGNWDGTNCDKCKEVGSTQMTDSECNIYSTVEINNLIWMKENLRYSGVVHYSANGNSSNDLKYGYLYNWENAKKACPTGWRLPTADEFLSLINGVDYGTTLNTKDVQDPSWVPTATNITGYSAIPAGGRYEKGSFAYFGSNAHFWSSTKDNTGVYRLIVRSSNAVVSTGNVTYGFSVRCVKDTNSTFLSNFPL